MMSDSVSRIRHVSSARVPVRDAGSAIAWEDGGYCPICFDYISCGETPVLVMIDTPTRERPFQSWAIAHFDCLENQRLKS